MVQSRRADAARRLDVGQVLEHQRVAAHQPREGRNAEDRDRDDHVGHAAAEDRDDADARAGCRGRRTARRRCASRCGPTSLRSSRPAGPARCRSTAPITTERKPAASEMRAPIRMRLKMSRPERVDAEPVRGRRAGVQLVVVEEVLGVVGHDPRRDDRDRDQQQHEDRRRPAPRAACGTCARTRSTACAPRGRTGGSPRSARWQSCSCRPHL